MREVTSTLPRRGATGTGAPSRCESSPVQGPAAITTDFAAMVLVAVSTPATAPLASRTSPVTSVRPNTCAPCFFATASSPSVAIVG